MASLSDDTARALQVRWQGFRGFVDTGWLRLRPITVLIGPNNAGKTSLTAPLLLLKQTWGSHTGRDALLTRGPLINAGSFGDIAYRHDPKKEMTLGLRWHSHPSSADLPPVGTYPPGSLEVSFGPAKDDPGIVVTDYRIRDTHRRTLVRRQRQPDGSYSLTIHAPGTSSREAEGASEEERVAARALRRAMTDARPVDFFFPGRSVRRALYETVAPDERGTLPLEIIDDRVRLYIQIADYVDFELDALFDYLYYIGPLREPPKRIYELSGEMPDDVGTRGECAPEIVYRQRDNSSFMKAVRLWLSHFGYDADLRTRSHGNDAFSIYLRQGPERDDVALADTGFGISQVLPLVVQGLQALPLSWIIIEQPEIHLNPRVQAQLGDFFAYLASREVGVIIETHSEHLLMRLRRLIADETLEPDQLGLVYVEREAQESKVRAVPVTEQGHIEPVKWPAGFFADALTESVRLAEAQMRRGALDAE